MMNYFEDKDITVYQITTSEDTDDYGESTETKDIVIKCKADIQPIDNEIIEKEFGKIENAKYHLWCCHKCFNKIKRDQLVEFTIHGDTKSYEIKAIKYWDDYTEFVVVDIKRLIPTADKAEEPDMLHGNDEEEDDIYG